MEGFQGTWISDPKQTKGMDEAFEALKLNEEQKAHFRNLKRLLQYKVDGDKVTLLVAEVSNFTVFSYKLGEEFERKGLRDEELKCKIELKNGKLIEQEHIAKSMFTSEPQDYEITTELKDKGNMEQSMTISGVPVSSTYVKQM